MTPLSKPNILFILCDSLAPHFTQPYGDGSSLTPNLARLADRGVVFENAYCNVPLCAPSRASLVTGRYASELGCFDNASAFASEWPTLGHSLGAVGYETAIIGKMHFVGYDQQHGFDQRIALETDYSKGYNPRLYQLAYDWKQASAGNPNSPHMMGESYLKSERWQDYRVHYERDELIHQAALDYLQQPHVKPYCAVVSYHAPHNPFWSPEEYQAPFRGKPLPLPKYIETPHGIMDEWLNDFHYLPENQAELMTKENLRWLYETFYGMVYDLDRRVGELIEVLEQADNTLIIFASDHGDMMGERGMVQKRTFYEKSVRVPLIFAWPKRWQQGARCKGPVSLIDLFPTLADTIQAPAPNDLPGKSLVSSLVGDSDLLEGRVFAEYHGEGVHAPCFMVRQGDYKYIYVHGHEERLYDLRSDPGERVNLIGDVTYMELRQLLRAQLLEAFNPEAVAQAARTSQHNRNFVYRCITE